MSAAPLSDDERKLQAMFPQPVIVEIAVTEGEPIRWKVMPMDLERCALFAGPCAGLLGPLRGSAERLRRAREIVDAKVAAGKGSDAKKNADVDAAADAAFSEATLSEMIAVFLEFAGHRPDDFLNGMAIAIGQPRSTIGMLPPAVLPQLVAVVAKVNFDFFLQRLGSQSLGGKAMLSTAANLVAAIGSMPSTTLSNGGTPTP